MTNQTAPFFPHRRRKDGALQSICLNCLATVGISRSNEELDELDRAHVCSSAHTSTRKQVSGTFVIPAKTSLRANISRFGEDDPRYAIHIIGQKNELYLRKTFGSWTEVERTVANLHLSVPLLNNAASRFAKGHIQYGEFVENLKPIEPELLGFQIDS